MAARAATSPRLPPVDTRAPRPVATPEIVVGEIHRKITDSRFDDAATIELARAGLVALAADIAAAR